MQWIMVIAVFIAADLVYWALCKASGEADKKAEELNEPIISPLFNSTEVKSTIYKVDKNGNKS